MKTKHTVALKFLGFTRNTEVMALIYEDLNRLVKSELFSFDHDSTVLIYMMTMAMMILYTR